MTPHEAFLNYWFGMLQIGIVSVAAIAVGFLLYSVLKPSLRVSIDWTPQKPKSLE
jgi:hypothetical protein